MDAFLHLPPDECRIVFEQAGASSGLSAPSVEKDFWVCWTLKELFALPEHGKHLTFKGGTSLSKVWRLIERFSEDIDLTIDRESLGFGGQQSPDKAASGKQQTKRLKGLRAACQERVKAGLLPAVEERWRAALPAGIPWSLAPDDSDNDQQTLLFHYPSCWKTEDARYVRPVVKMEFGARSDTWPAEAAVVKPFVAEQLPQAFKVSQCPRDLFSQRRAPVEIRQGRDQTADLMKPPSRDGRRDFPWSAFLCVLQNSALNFPQWSIPA